MSTAEICSFETEITRVDLDCMALRRASRINRIRARAYTVARALYISVSLVAIVSACVR
jgi:hypothetical protein